MKHMCNFSNAISGGSWQVKNVPAHELDLEGKLRTVIEAAGVDTLSIALEKPASVEQAKINAYVRLPPPPLPWVRLLVIPCSCCSSQCVAFNQRDFVEHTIGVQFVHSWMELPL